MSENDSTPPDGFRLIPGFPRYAIDENGTILSVCGNGRGAASPWSKARRLNPVKQRKGYPHVSLRQGSRMTTVNVHTLVLTAFVGPRPDGMECRHIDGSRTNNHISNLAWGTSRQNAADRVLHGTVVRGERNGHAKLTTDDVLEIRRMVASGEILRVLADKFRISEKTVYDIAIHRIWKHVAGPQYDRAHRDTSCRGESHGRAKLTAVDVLEIRRRFTVGVPISVLAAEFHIRREHMWRIATGRSWKHIA